MYGAPNLMGLASNLPHVLRTADTITSSLRQMGRRLSGARQPV